MRMSPRNRNHVHCAKLLQNLNNMSRWVRIVKKTRVKQSRDTVLKNEVCPPSFFPHLGLRQTSSDIFEFEFNFTEIFEVAK